MSQVKNTKLTTQHAEHGTTKSYVIGFVLSIVFSLIPYFVVVNKSMSGTALQATILVFAMIQMLIQITFFLHLGRGPKPDWNLFFFISTAGIIAVVVGGSVFIIDNLHYNMSPEEKVKKIANDEGIYQVGGKETGACRELGTNYRIVIKDDIASPQTTGAAKCDTLTFINEDDDTKEITFGPHPDHGTYAGVEELAVRSGKSKTITLSETGSYSFHDHLQPETAGEFSVAE